MKRPPYDLKELRREEIETRKKVARLLSSSSGTDRRDIEDQLRRERDRLKRLRNLVRKHVEYRRYTAAEPGKE